MNYKASLDTTSKTVTVLITVLFFFIIILQTVLFVQYRVWPSFAVAIVLLLVYVMTYAYQPLCYKIKDRNVIVHRHLSDVIVLRSEIKNIQLIDNQKLKGSIRTFGVGGVFGYFGQFLNRDLGCMTWYATQRDHNAVLIELTNNKKIILTPDEPEQFVQQLSLSA